MTSKIKNLLLFLFIIAMIFSSCRKEEMEIIESPPENTLVANSLVSSLMQRTTLNDGSNDNIVDLANCFNIQMPFTVIANGNTIMVESGDDFEVIEDIFDQYDEDIDDIIIEFPVTIILSDYTEITVNNENELSNYSANCNGENQYDDDIECIDFQYPINASLFNTSSEFIDAITITNDYQLYNFLEDLDETLIVSIDFPLTVIIYDGASLEINDLNELANTIDAYDNICDEDDDYDYNDDDCNNCTPVALEELMVSCADWIVDKLERDNQDYEDIYEGYIFNFYSDYTLQVYWDGTTVNGTWSTSGTGNNITVTIDIPALPPCNADWLLHEIDQYGETKVDLRVGDDRLRYESECN